MAKPYFHFPMRPYGAVANELSKVTILLLFIEFPGSIPGATRYCEK
jgi:hypothetical protein